MKRFTYANVVATAALAVAVGLTPAGAHVTDSLTHLWDDHIEPKLSQAGTINKKANPVHWTKLKGVPGALADGKDAAAPKNVVRYDRIKVVSGKGTPTANGTKLLNALSAATGANAVKPRLIQLEPGTYELQQTLTMRPYVDIAGSGRNASTILMDDTADSVVLIDMASNSTLRDLNVKRTNAPQSDPYATAVRVQVGSSNVHLERLNVRIEAAGTPDVDPAVSLQGIRADGEATLDEVEVVAATFEGDAFGLFSSAAVDVRDSILIGQGDAADNVPPNYGVYGVWTSSSSVASVGDSSIFAFGPGAEGARASHGGALYLKDSLVSATHTAVTSDLAGSTLDIKYSKLLGGTDAVNHAGATTRIAFSELEGGTTGAGIVCASNIDTNMTYFTTTCPT